MMILVMTSDPKKLRMPVAMSLPQVSTTSGECVGKKVSVDGVDVYRWLGIPYAENTAGRYRFRKPRRRIEKQRTMAQDPRPPCPQLVNHTVVGSEDCLHMNVWAPKGESGSGLNRTLVLASVSYWFQRGSNNDPDWAELAAKADVVVMSPNMRLGVLGFLHPNESTAKDVAKEDAKEAVKWAVDNAAAFGAHPDAVVLVGHGSGAYMLIEAVSSLNIRCTRAILEGPVLGALWPMNMGKLEPSRNLSTSINCTGRDRNSISLRCLRNSTLEVLLRAAARLKFRFAPSLGDLQQFSKGPALEIPEVIAGVDINQVKIFFDEYVRPVAMAARYDSTPDNLWNFTLSYFFPSDWNWDYGVRELARYAGTENQLLTNLALYMGGCDTRLLVRKASVKGFHYMTDGAEKQLFEPILDMAAVVNFIKDG
ncbi:cholinesterase-like [Haemaphysalis longicornis]